MVGGPLDPGLQAACLLRRRNDAPGGVRGPPGRAKCEVKREQLEVLLKAHVSTLDDRGYVQEDVDDIVQAYQGFLCAVAALTLRLNATVMTKVCKKVFNLKDKQCQDFGDAMAKALAHCVSKARRATSGKKLNPAVAAVILAFRNAPDDIKAVQDSMLGKSKSSASSPPKEEPERARSASPTPAVEESPNKKARRMYGLPSPPRGAGVITVCSSDAGSLLDEDVGPKLQYEHLP